MVFFTLAVLFILLAVGDFTGVHSIKIIAGWVGIFCGLSAMYTSLATVVNNEFGRTVFPLG